MGARGRRLLASSAVSKDSEQSVCTHVLRMTPAPWRLTRDQRLKANFGDNDTTEIPFSSRDSSRSSQSVANTPGKRYDAVRETWMEIGLWQGPISRETVVVLVAWYKLTLHSRHIDAFRSSLYLLEISTGLIQSSQTLLPVQIGHQSLTHSRIQ